MTALELDVARWFVCRQPRPAAPVQLFCLPYAGGGASVYRAWPAALGPRVEVVALRLPGREGRLDEPPVFEPDEVATAISARADRPYALYGHSMGARLAFEVIRVLRARGERLPIRLYVAAARPPDVVGDGLLDGVSKLPRAELLGRLSAGGGMPAALLAEPELLDVVLPPLRADFEWLDQYQFVPADPIPVPIVTFAGSDDPAVDEGEMAGWQRHTTAEVDTRVVTGGHFFLNDQLPALAELIATDLSQPGHPAPHRGQLGRTAWSVWRDGLLRATGFPADGLDLFYQPALGAVADRALAGEWVDAPTTGVRSDEGALAQFEAEFADEIRRSAEVVDGLAGLPLLREAVTWQNPAALTALDHLANPGDDPRRASKRRERETVLIRYWQRYCGKNDTIGFFGPSCWVTVDPDEPIALQVRPGPELTRRRRVFLEPWALTAFADQLASDPDVRRWFPVLAAPHQALVDRLVRRPAGPPIELTAVEAAAVRAATGRPAVEVAATLVADPALGLRREADAYLLFGRLVDRGVLRWGADLPLHPRAEDVLRQRLAAIGDEPVRERAVAEFDRLSRARDAVAGTAGDPDRLRAALVDLAAVFADVTGLEGSQRAGETYAGRTLCYEDCERDLDVVVGGPLLDEIAGPLSVLLQAGRWLTVALADAYGAALRELYTELADDGGPVRLSDLWYLAQGPLWGAADRPVDAVAADFAGRWADLFGLSDSAPEGGSAATRRDAVVRTTSELLPRVAAAFPARAPGWSAGFIQSPDLHICAPTVEAVNRGDYSVVLGEMHVWPTFDCAVFTGWHPDPDLLRAGLAADLGPGRVRLLYPSDWPRHTGRVAHSLADASDVHLAFSSAPGSLDDHTLSASAVIVADVDGELIGTGPDGRSWPLIEIFSAMLAMHAADGFKLVAPAPHTPRVTVDRLVVSRETWRCTVDDSGLATARGERDRYLAARRWRSRLGLPDRVYVKIGTEVKPFYADLSSPLFTTALCNAMRGARVRAGADVPVAVTEMLPKPDDAWVPDQSGRRYFSELRLQVTDAEVRHG